MADDIALNRAQRTTLFSLQQIERDSAVSQRRLSFGRKIVDVTDGATQFFQARSLTNRLSDIRDRGEQIDQAISALQTFVGGAQNLQNLLDIARGHVLRAEANLENTAVAAQTRQSITRDFREVLRNFFETANSLQYNGLNLLVDADRSFSVRFSDRANDRLVVQGRNLFDNGAYTLDKGNLFGRDIINNNGFFNFVSTQLNLNAATTRNSIVIRGELDAASATALATDGSTGANLVTPIATVEFRPGATLSVGATTNVRVDGAETGTPLTPEYTTIGTTGQTYRNVDRVSFVTSASTRVVDNGDGSYTITGLNAGNTGTTIPGLQIGAGATSNTAAADTVGEVAGFSGITTASAAILDDIRYVLDLAKNRLETIESFLGSNVALLQERLSFGIGYGNDLTIGRDKIVLADVNQEAAILTTLRTRNQIGIGALASNAESEQQLLRLLS